MKVFVIFLILIGIGFSVANAQYADVEFYHMSVNTGSGQHSVLMQSEHTTFNKAVFDKPAEALLFSITPSDVIDTITITLNVQTMHELFSNLPQMDPKNMVLLINGEIKPYIVISDNKTVSWMFYVPPTSTEIELIPPTSMFEPTKNSENIPFNALKVYPPLKQMHLGIMAEQIQCKQNLVLIQKYDGMPACVTESTKLKLIERGWTDKNETKPTVLSDEEKCAKQFNLAMNSYIEGQQPRPDSNGTMESFKPDRLVLQSEHFASWRSGGCAFSIPEWAHLSDYEDWIWENIGPTYKIKGLASYVEVNEPIFVTVEKIGYHMCDSWDASIISQADNATVWDKQFHSLCVVADNPTPKKFQYTISNEINPIVISNLGNYTFQIEIGPAYLEKEFSVKEYEGRVIYHDFDS